MGEPGLGLRLDPDYSDVLRGCAMSFKYRLLSHPFPFIIRLYPNILWHKIRTSSSVFQWKIDNVNIKFKILENYTYV
jgi:hypothetical protein